MSPSKIPWMILGGIVGLLCIPIIYSLVTLEIAPVFDKTFEAGAGRVFSLVLCGTGIAMEALKEPKE